MMEDYLADANEEEKFDYVPEQKLGEQFENQSVAYSYMQPQD